MSRAPKKVMEAMHAALASTLADMISNGVEVLDKNGDPVRVAAPAAVLNVARQFLKDNNIDGLPVSSPEAQALIHKLPFTPSVEEEEATFN